MGKTEKNNNYLTDLLNHQHAYFNIVDSKKDSFYFFKESFCDPFSKECLSLYQLINSYIIRFEKEIFLKGEVDKIFQSLVEEFSHLNLGNSSQLKKSWQAIIIKRRILPNSCFINGKFEPKAYKKLLFLDLEQRALKAQSLLSLCYHFGSEFQETCALLSGQLIDLEEITLELVCFIEHKLGVYKHTGLFIQDSILIQSSIYLFLNNPNIKESEYLTILNELLNISKNIELDSFLLEIFEWLNIKTNIESNFKLLFNKFNPKELLSFSLHLENLLKIFDGNKDKILKLCSDYIESVESKALFFEKDYIPEIPIILDLLMLINNNETSFFIQKTNILNFFSYIIDNYNEDHSFLLKLIKSETKIISNNASTFIKYFNLSKSPSIKEINDLFLIFQSLKKLNEKNEPLKLLKILCKERFLSICRISIDTVRLNKIKNLKELELVELNPEKKISSILNYLNFSSIEIENYIKNFYSIF